MLENRYPYAREKLELTIEVFMTSSGKDKDKIKNTYIHHLSRLQNEDIPETSQESWKYLTSILNDNSQVAEWDKDNKLGTLHHSISTLNPRSINKIKRVIWEMFQDVI